MELSWNELLSANEGKFYLVSGRERDLDIFKNKFLVHQKNNVLIRIFRGQRCGSKKSLYQEFAAAMQFPYYFGHNWDAFDECINDLNWLPANKYVILITNFHEVLSENPEDLSIFMDIIKETIRKWVKETRNNIPNQTPVAFTVILHCEPEREKKCKEILDKESIKPVMRILKPYDDIL